MVRIVESYRDYVPPWWIRPTVERLLATLEPRHVGNLDAIVLTSSALLGRGKTQRVAGRKHRQRDCRGFYHPASRGEGRAWIELVVDNIVPQSRRLWFNAARDAVVGETLYHEIGHHLHETVGSAARGGEASADDWSRRLSELHFRRCYARWNRVLVVLDPILLPLAKWMVKRLERRAGLGHRVTRASNGVA